MVFHRYLVNCSWGVHISSVYVHSVICVTYLVSHYSICVLSIGVLGVDVSSVYVHSAICDTYLV